MEEVDEFGIPIKKPTQSDVDEFGIPIKKKVPTKPVSSVGGEDLLDGSESSQLTQIRPSSTDEITRINDFLKTAPKAKPIDVENVNVVEKITADNNIVTEKATVTGVELSPVDDYMTAAIRAYEDESVPVFMNAIKRGSNQADMASSLTAFGDDPEGATFEEIAKIQASNRDLRTSEAYANFSQQTNFVGAMNAFTKAPATIIAELTLESMTALLKHGLVRIGAGAASGAVVGSVIPGAGTLAGAGYGAIAGMGSASLNLEYAGKMMEVFGEMGVDTTDPKQLEEVFSDEKKVAEARSHALKKGIPVAIFDMVSGGVAGKIVSKPAKTLLAKAGGWAVETGIQGTLGATGELAGQVVAGEEINTGAAVAEFIGELGGGAGEVAVGSAVRQAKRKSDLVKSVGALPPDTDKATIAKEQVALSLVTGEITTEEAAELTEAAAIAVEVDKIIPVQVEGIQRAESLPILIEKKQLEGDVAMLEAQKEATDPSFHSVIDEQIKVVQEQVAEKDNQIKAIISPEPTPQTDVVDQPIDPVANETKPIELFHGSATPIEGKLTIAKERGVGNNILNAGNGIYLTENPEAAKYFAWKADQNKQLKEGIDIETGTIDNEGITTKISITPDAKILDVSEKVDVNTVKEIAQKNGVDISTASDEFLSDFNNLKSIFSKVIPDKTAFAEWFTKEAGYDGIRLREQAWSDISDAPKFIDTAKIFEGGKAPVTVVVYNQDKISDTPTAEGTQEAITVTEEKVVPIRQLGTGANVYFETKKYRVNDSSDGKVFLNVGNANDEVPLANIKLDSADEAVFMAKKLEESSPDGLVADYHNIDAIVKNLKEEYKNQSTNNSQSKPQSNEQEVNQKGRQKELLNEATKTEPVSEAEVQPIKRVISKVVERIEKTFGGKVRMAKNADEIKAISEEGTKFNFVGEKAKLPESIKASFEKAKKMDSDKIGNEEIRKKTGWFKGRYDNKWRYESKPIAVNSSRATQAAQMSAKNKSDVPMLLSDVIAGSEILALYPELNNVLVVFTDKIGDNANAAYKKDDKTGQILIAINPKRLLAESNKGRSLGEKFLRMSVAHEVQHIIQSKEGFARGSSPQEIRNKVDSGSIKTNIDPSKLNESEKNAYVNQLYQLVAGEIESRDVAWRGQLTQYQRNQTTPYSSENINGAIVLGGESNAQMSVSSEGKVLGAVLPDGTIILNEEEINANTPIHEAGHLWQAWAKQNRPDLYKAGLVKVNGSPYMVKVKTNKFYREQASKLPESERAEFYADEALAMAIGDKGEQFVTQSKKSDFKQWLDQLWSDVSKFFGIEKLTQNQLDNLTLDEFTSMVSARILEGRKLESAKEQNTTDAKIEAANKRIDAAAKALKDILKVDVVPNVKKSGADTGVIIDMIAQATKQLVARGIKTQAALEQVISALRDRGVIAGKEITKMRKFATSQLESDLTKLWVSKDGKTSISTNENGDLVARNDKGKLLSPKEERKVIKEYTETKNLTKGTLADLEGVSEQDAERKIAEESENPMQIAQAMANSTAALTEDDLDFKQKMIADFLPPITTESFVDEKDAADLLDEKGKFQEGTSIAFNYLRKDGYTLDQAVEKVNSDAQLEKDTITANDIIDFILAHPKGRYQFYSKKNPNYTKLAEKFKELTGFYPTKEILERAKGFDPYAEKEEDFAGMEPAEKGVTITEEPQEKTRGLAKQDMKNPKISGESKAMISDADKKYIVQTNKMSLGEARAIISRVGAEAADEMVRDKNNGMNGAVRTALSQGLKMYYEKTGQYEKMISLTKWMYFNATDVGQEIQMMSRLAEITPDYTFESSEQLYKDATRSAENPDGLPMPEYLRNYFEKLAKETEALQKKYDELKSKQLDKNVQATLDNINEADAREKKTPAQRRASLSEEKKARKLELRKKFSGVFNDFTNIPALLANKEFFEYNKLIVEEAVNDFKTYVKILVEEMGGKARQYARELYTAGGGTELPELPKPYYDEQGNLKISPQLIREIVANAENKLTADELVAKVKEEVIQDLPDVTDTEIKEAISGYGKTVNPSKDEVDAEIRRLKRDGRLELGLKDVLEGKGVKRTGLQRDKPTDYQRELERKIKEELKLYPPDQESVQKKWASALDRTKTHLKNQIADIGKRIQDIKDGIAEPLPSKKRGFELDEEAKELQALRDDLKKALLELEPKQEMSDEQRVKLTVVAVERAIEATAQKIKDRDFGYKKKTVFDSPEIKAAKERLKQGKDVLNRMRQEEGFAAQHAYELWKKRINERIAKLQKQLDEKDFAIKPKKIVELTDEQFRLKVKLEKLQFERDVAIEKEKQKNLSGFDYWENKIADIVGLPKALMASADLSAPLRQGAVLSAKHPVIATRAAKEMFRQLFSEARQSEWVDQLHATESYPYMKHAKLFLSEPSAKLSAKEEDFVSNIAEKIPIWGKVVKGSARAYTAYLNKLRVDVFNQYYDALRRDGYVGAELEKELESYAKFINNATGRGHLGRLETSALLLNSAFFSPRYVASRFNLMNPVYYAGMTPRVRMEALKTVGTYIGVGAMTLALLNAMGGDDDEGKDKFTIEIDPRSSDFGKLKWGDTRFDIWAGFQQFVRLFSQIATGEKKTQSGIKELGEGYKADDELDIIGRFFRSKLSPAAATAANLIGGTDMMGQEVTVGGELQKMIVPLYVSDMYEVYQMEGVGKAVATTLPAIFGVGVQTYVDKEKMPLTKEDVQKEMDKRAQEKIDAKDRTKIKEAVVKRIENKKENRLKEEKLKKAAKEFDVKYVNP